MASEEIRTPTKLISMTEVCTRTGRSRWWVRMEYQAGRFPKPVPMCSRVKMFVEAEVEAYIQSIIAKRDVQQGEAA